MLDVSFKLLATAERPLKNRSRVRVYHGTHEILARVVLFDREELAPGDTAYVQLRLEAPTVAMARDRYIVRQYSPVFTIGGGEILFVHPQKHTAKDDILPQLQRLHTGSLEEVVEIYVKDAELSPVTPRAIAGMLAVVEQEITDALQSLIRRHAVVNTVDDGIAVIHTAHYQALSHALAETVENFHKTFPLKTGMAKEELRKKLPSSLTAQVFQQLLREHVRAGQLRIMQDLVCHAGHQVQLSPAQQRIKDQLSALYLSKNVQPPLRKEAVAQVNGSEKDIEAMLRLLLDEGILVRVETDLHYHQESLRAIVEQTIAYLQQHQEMTVGDFKTLLGVSRKYAVPLLAHLDASGVTLRKGDVRILRQQREA
jgi:selenocysteine-specific elongation factor